MAYPYSFWRDVEKMDLSDGVSILSMSLINTNTGEELVLFEREDSKCLFNKEIEHEGYILQLRVDWTDIAQEILLLM
jgi:hypothetical protein